MTNKWKKKLMILTAAAMAWGLAACGSSPSEEKTGTAQQTEQAEQKDAKEQEAPAELEKATVILDYVPNTNHTGIYTALDRGYYEEEGLDVEVIEPTDGATATLVAQQKGNFGISYQEDVTIAKSSEDPLPIKTVAAIIQHNTSGFVSLADSGIESPADFEGKTYAGWGGPGESAVLEACMTKEGADFSKLDMVISDGTGFEALGKSCDIMWFFEGWDSVMAEMNDCKLNYMECRQLDERLDYYTPVIITSDAQIESDPEMVSAFLRATQKGYKDVIEDPEGCAEILHAYAPDYDEEMLKKSQTYLAGKFMEDTDTWGEMKDEVWERYSSFLQEYGVIEKALPPSDYYTNEFLDLKE